ncbi:MAG: class I SAM-dependent methyltransferase [Nitrospinae bacterium]|nr:class I SAM-dependent methyltransferase [Nitrospinota bacterium]
MRNWLGAAFFRWLQRQRFYADVHAEAVSAVPSRGLWHDIGCGPGLIPGIASERGFAAVGFDMNPASVIMAQKLYPKVHFFNQDLDTLAAAHGEKPDVISISSLLFVLPDRVAALNRVWGMLKPGGYLLIIETGSLMNLPNVIKYSIRQGRFSFGLCLWGIARSGATVEDEVLRWAKDRKLVEEQKPLGGMLHVWVFRKEV